MLTARAMLCVNWVVAAIAPRKTVRPTEEAISCHFECPSGFSNGPMTISPIARASPEVHCIRKESDG